MVMEWRCGFFLASGHSPLGTSLRSSGTLVSRRTGSAGSVLTGWGPRLEFNPFLARYSKGQAMLCTVKHFEIPRR